MLLPQVCSHIAASSLEACQRHNADAPCVIGAQQLKHVSESHHSVPRPRVVLPEGATWRVPPPGQPLTSASAPDPSAQRSIPGGAEHSPVKEAFMHAVLQSLADICKDGLGEGLVSSIEQRPSTASAALSECHPAHDRAVSGREDPLREEKSLRIHHETQEQPAQRIAPRPAQQRQVRANQERRVAPSGSKGPRSAGLLVRLKATLRKPKIPIRVAAPSQTAAHAAEPHGSLPDCNSHVGLQGDFNQGMRVMQSNAEGQTSAQARTAPELARSSSWQTEEREDACMSSCNMSASEGRVMGMPAEAMPESRLPGMEPPPPTAVAAEPRPLNIRGIEHIIMPMEPQGLAERALECNEELPQGQPHVRSGHQHKHPARRRHRKPTQPCSSTPSTGKPLSFLDMASNHA